MTSSFQIKGRYRFTTYEAGTKNVIEVGPWIHNLVVEGTNNGIGLIAQRLAGFATYDIQITTAAIGTGNTAPADTDTALVTPVLTGIPRSLQSFTANSAHVEFFIPNSDLANGVYKEFAVYCGTRLFARSLITPNFTKGSNVDTGIEYNFSLTN